ncbi:MAG TPA: sulfite exporter TauE/SafE family protein, partial [Gammaproteobacteria bacterium]|nr:sulfite exporter TauE/SafE family protein [Gammaproteobacteria bacterium]
MEVINPLIAFNLGLFSTLHCLGMCGGIISALTLGVGYSSDSAYSSRAGFVLAYNSGRIISYTVAGTVCGFVGQEIFDAAIPAYGHRYLQYAAATVLVLIGLHLAGWLPRLRQIESFGLRIWKLIQPAARFFMPVENVGQALAIGMIWGWLP